MMFFARQAKKRTQIRLRPCPSAAGDFLYFPFDYYRGGLGYAVKAADIDRAKTADWDPFSFVFVPTLLLGLLIAWLFDYDVVGSILGLGLGLWLGFINYDWQKRRFDAFLAGLTPMPHRLTKRRYWMERSLQTSRLYMAAISLFALFLFILLLGTALYGFTGENNLKQGIILILAAGMTGHYAYRAFMFVSSRWRAKGLTLGRPDGLLPENEAAL